MLWLQGTPELGLMACGYTQPPLIPALIPTRPEQTPEPSQTPLGRVVSKRVKNHVKLKADHPNDNISANHKPRNAEVKPAPFRNKLLYLYTDKKRRGLIPG